MAAFRARNSSAIAPKTTKRPTITSVVFLLMCAPKGIQGVENIRAVRMKSIASTPREAVTTVRVVA